MEKNNRTAVIVALITLVGVISAAVIANWDKIAGKNKEPSTNTGHQTQVINYESIAQGLVTKWFSAIDISDIDYLMSVSEPPFYFHHSFLLTKSEIREFYNSFNGSKKINDEKGNTIDIFKIGTIAKFKADGLTGKYLDIEKLNLNDDDYFVQLGQSSREGGLVFIFKKTGETLKLYGLLAS